MLVKYLDRDDVWTLCETLGYVEWTYHYKTCDELQEELTKDTYNLVIFPDEVSEVNEPPANGYRTLVVKWLEEDGDDSEWVVIATTMQCYILNNDGKTIENLSP